LRPIETKTSDYFRQRTTISTNFSASNSWVVLDETEKRIKEKIEKLGVPLKEWDVQINYGIKTGFNEAFIITTEKRQELLKKCPEADSIIRPILRGKDIHKFNALWNDLYIIGTLPSLNINIEKYPSIKRHLLSFGIERLEQTGLKYIINGEPVISRKKTGNKWFEIQDQINYWRDFLKPKIIYPEITKFINFYLDEEEHYFVNNKCFILSGENIEFLTAFLNSSIFKFCFIENFPELLGGTRELRKVFFEKIPVKKVTASQNILFKEKVTQIQNLKKNNQKTLQEEIEIDNMIFDLYDLTAEERTAIGFIEII
jgi:hypothetical protein